MTNQKALIGNEMCGIFLKEGGKPERAGFVIYLLAFMFSCATVHFEYCKVQIISIGIFGIVFDFSICHPWVEYNNKKNCKKKN